MLELSVGRPRSLLCLGAHCDDIEIGAGATIRQLIAQNPRLRVHWIVFSSTEARAAEARASAIECLDGAGDADVRIRAFTDGYFPGEFTAIKRDFEALKEHTAPDIVLTHFRDDRHQDHRVVSDLTWNTFRDHLVLEYEVPKYDGDLSQPNVFVPVDDVAREAKVRALMRHFASQASKHWFTPETFNAQMRIRGLECRSATGYAEAFHGRKVVLSR